MDFKKKTNEKLQSWSEINKERKRKKKEYKEKSIENKKKKLDENVKETEQENVEKNIEENREVSTLSIAVPGSILENAQTEELRTYLAGQIARAACLYQVDEIVVFDDYADEASTKKSTSYDSFKTKTIRNSCGQLAMIIQYLECPQYLRKFIFPIHKNLKFTGLINPLNAPHHFSSQDQFEFREGVVTNKPVKQGGGSFVFIGLRQDAQVNQTLNEGTRCTVKLHPETIGKKKLKGTLVSPDEPRKQTGIYWGYRVRLAKSLSEVFSECRYKDGYDLTIGTSDRGSSIDSFQCPAYKHVLVLFGGVKGLEFALENDPILEETDPELIFDSYLNTLPHQGSKTIRTEEAVLITLASLRTKLNPKFPPISFENKVTTNLTVPSNDSAGSADDLSRFD